MYPGLLAAVQPEELSPIPRAERSAVVYTHMFLLTLGGPDQAGGLLLGTIKLLLFKPQLALRCLLGVISAFFVIIHVVLRHLYLGMICTKEKAQHAVANLCHTKNKCTKRRNTYSNETA